MWNELLYTLKLLLKNIRYSLLCMSVIAVGLGILLPMFAIVNNTLYQTPQINQGDRFVTFWKELANQRQFGLSLYDNFHYAFFRANSTSFQTLKAWRDASITVSDGEYPEVYRSAETEPGLLDATGVQPLLGRIFLPDDALPGATPVAVISYNVWQNYYTGRQDIIGHEGRINGQTRTIVGVLPQEFAFPINHDLWLPLVIPAVANAGDGPENLLVTGILAEGASLRDADREIRILQAQIKAGWPELYAHIAGSQVLPYLRVVGGAVDANAMLIILASIMLLVMFNVGNLFFARGEERVYELAIRGALGASHGKIMLALMLESFLVCVAGLILGLLISHFAMAFIDASNTDVGGSRGFWWHMGLDRKMLTFSILMTLLIWFISGGLPAWRMSRKSLGELLSNGSKGVSDKGTTRLNKILVNLQLVSGCVLLTLGTTTAFMGTNTVMTTLKNSDTLYFGRVSLGSSYIGNGVAQQNFRTDLMQALARQGAVAGSTYSTNIPGKGTPQLPYTIEEEDLAVNEIYPRQFAVSIADNYFALMGVDIVQGRNFTASDTQDSLRVAIVDQRLVDKLWPDESALGKRIQLNPGDETSPWLTIVGVSAASRHEGAYYEGDTGVPVLYQPIQQSNPARFYVIYRSENPGFAYLQVLRAAVAQTDRDVPVTDIRSALLEESRMIKQGRTNMYIAGALMLLAMYLSAIATYGLAVRAVGRRRVETGIRMALGANVSISTMVFLKDGLKTVATGLSIGCLSAVSMAYLILTAADLNGFSVLIKIAISICVLMGSLVMLANYFPAKKIIAMEPADALRYE